MAVAVFLCLTQKGFPSRVAARKFVLAFQEVRGHEARKIFKIKGPRLAKNAFPEIYLGKAR